MILKQTGIKLFYLEYKIILYKLKYLTRMLCMNIACVCVNQAFMSFKQAFIRAVC